MIKYKIDKQKKKFINWECFFEQVNKLKTERERFRGRERARERERQNINFHYRNKRILTVGHIDIKSIIRE